MRSQSHLIREPAPPRFAYNMRQPSFFRDRAPMRVRIQSILLPLFKLGIQLKLVLHSVLYGQGRKTQASMRTLACAYLGNIYFLILTHGPSFFLSSIVLSDRSSPWIVH